MNQKELLSLLSSTLLDILPELRQICHARFLTSDTNHQVFYFEALNDQGILQRLVIRAPLIDNGRYKLKRLLREHKLLQHLYQEGFYRIPQAFYHGYPSTSFSFPIAVQSYIVGHDLKKVTFEQITELAYILHKLHAFNGHPYLTSILTANNTWYEVASIVLQHQRQWINTVFSAQPSAELMRLAPLLNEVFTKVAFSVESCPTCFQQPIGSISLIHGDLGSHNFRLAEDGIYLLDWELASSGDPAYDVAFLFQSDDFSRQERSTFISAYWEQSDDKLLGSFLDRVAVYEHIAAWQQVFWSARELTKTVPRTLPPQRTDKYYSIFHRSLMAIDPDLLSQAEAILAFPRQEETSE